uniref:Integrase catalytic domain-containing protein n=1 Tax=Bracon brevicornis TaxID=1563983 RepID=A0A6V7M0T8_9HYME
MSEGENMEQHLGKMQNLTDKLQSLGSACAKELGPWSMLCSVPASYDQLVTTLANKPENELTIDLIKGTLLSEFRRRQNQGLADGCTEQAMKVNKLDDECFFCHETGHQKRNCLKYKKYLKNRKGSKPKFKASKVEEHHGDTDEDGEHNVYTDRAYSAVRHKVKCPVWYFDSAATRHMTPDIKFFKTFDPTYTSKVRVANKQYSDICSIGTGQINCRLSSGKTKVLTLKDVLYAPSFYAGLFFLSTMAKLGYELSGKGDQMTLFKDGEEVAIAMAKNDMYEIMDVEDYMRAKKEVKQVEKASGASHHNDKCIHTWHRRFGHRDPKAIEKLIENELAEGVEIKKCNEIQVCSSCIKGKLSRKPFPKESLSKTTKRLELLHMDLCGPMPTKTVGGRRYLMTIIDDFSRYTFVYLLTEKSQDERVIRDFIAEMKTQYGEKPKCFRSDRGGEFMSHDLMQFLAKQGVKVQRTAPYTPEQNGVAERKNRTLVEATRTMLIDAGLADQYWGEAVMTAGYVQNLLPTRVRDKTPFELFFDKKPDISHLRVYGCKAYAHIPKQMRLKLDNKTRECIFVGYSQESKAYRLLEENTGKILTSRDIKFVENIIPRKGKRVLFGLERGETAEKLKQQVSAHKSDTYVYVPVDSIDNNACVNHQGNTGIRSQGSNAPEPPVMRETQESSDNFETPDGSISMTDEASESESVEDVPLAWRLRRGNNEPVINVDYSSENETPEEVPRTVEEALSGVYAEQWRKAMDEEMESLSKNETWDLEPKSANKNVIGCKWVFTIKRHADGSPKRFKARLVAQGFSQRYGIDYDEVFAPVVRQTTLRTLLSIAGRRGFFVKHLDAKTAFLNGKLSKTIYMRQPPNYVDEGKPEFVCRLNKSLYGLKQAAKAWHDKLDEVLHNMGFEKCPSDHCLYRTMEGEPEVYLAVHVDDMIIASKSSRRIEAVKEALNREFSITDMGDLKFYLGIGVRRDDNRNFYLNQGNYIRKILTRARLSDAKNSTHPMDVGYEKAREKSPRITNESYQKLIGALLYLLVHTRPDISAAVAILSQRIKEPRQTDWNELQRICRYLKYTIDFELRLSDQSRDDKLIGYADANLAESRDSRKSNSGYIFKLFGGTISWSSKRQECVTLSSTEAELVALSEASREAKWIRKLLTFFNEHQNEPTTIYEDNQSCINSLKGPGSSNRSKHIDTKYFYTRELKERRIIQVTCCPTETNEADMFTKPLGPTKLSTLVKMIGLKNWSKQDEPNDH